MMGGGEHIVLFLYILNSHMWLVGWLWWKKEEVQCEVYH